MIILGVDAGLDLSGVAIYDSETHEVLYKEIVDNEEFLEDLGKLTKKYDVDIAVLEMIASYGMPVGFSTFETVFYIGKFHQRLADLNIKTRRLYKKKEINKAICNNGNAKDKNIRQAIMDMFPHTGGGKNPSVGTKAQQGPLYGVASHMWAALACCLTYKILYIKD